MITTRSVQEDKLLIAARCMDEQQLDVLMRFVNSLTGVQPQKEATDEDRKNFDDFLCVIGEKAAEKGLTPEILEELLARDE